MARRSSKPTDDTPEDDDVGSSPQDEEAVGSEAALAEPATPEADDTQTPEAPQPSWRERLGGEWAGMDDDTALSRLQERLTAAERAEQAQSQAQQWQYLYAQQRQAQELAQQQAAAQAQQKPAEKTWNPPKFDPQWLQFVETDANGNLVAKSGADPTLPQQIKQYAAWKQENEQKFWNDPYGFVMQGIAPQVQTIAQQIVQQQVAQERNAFAIREWERDKLPVLTTDGRVVAQDGSNLTEIGKRIAQEAQRLAQSGVTDPIHALDTAYSIVSGQVAWAHANQQQQQTGTVQQAAAKKQQFLQQTAKANRTGNAPKNGASAPVIVPRMSARERLAKAFAAAGADPNEN